MPLRHLACEQSFPLWEPGDRRVCGALILLETHLPSSPLTPGPQGLPTSSLLPSQGASCLSGLHVALRPTSTEPQSDVSNTPFIFLKIIEGPKDSVHAGCTCQHVMCQKARPRKGENTRRRKDIFLSVSADGCPAASGKLRPALWKE